MSDDIEVKEYEKPILLEDLGMKFSTENSKKKRRFGLFKCFCGNEFVAIIANIKNGNTRSCGCLVNQNKATHRLSNHRLYYTWNKMIQRCYNPKNKNYIEYGARGITVCDRWHSIENFIEDLFPTFKEGLSLDRINVDGDYEPSNCRWVTKSIQARNTRLLMSTNTSGFRGVCWYRANNKWKAQITVNNKRIYLGYFSTPLEGAIAYNNYIIKNNLEHPLNIIPEDYLRGESND